MTAHPWIPLNTYASVAKHTHWNQESVPLTQNWRFAFVHVLAHSHSTPRGAQKAVALSTELWAHSSTAIRDNPYRCYIILVFLLYVKSLHLLSTIFNISLPEFLLHASYAILPAQPV